MLQYLFLYELLPALVPRYVGNMHGNEVVGREVLLALAEYLVYNYGVIDRVTKLLNTTEVLDTASAPALYTPALPPQIHLVPTMNPDGYMWTNRGEGRRPIRHNANDVDLNR